jgi:hypothetical protein
VRSESSDPPTIPAAALRAAAFQLLAASSIALFQELAFIRWIPGEVRVAAYFPNLVLIATFLGLGVGSLRSRGRSLLFLWPVSLVLIVAASVLMGRIAFTAEGVSEHLWLLYDDLPEDALVLESIRAPIVLLFLLTTLSFVPLGQLIGERLQTFRVAGRSLRGYALDLGGSLAGVVLFGFVAFGALGPVFWFAPFLVGGLYLLREHHYALSAVPIEGLPDLSIRANGALHQVAADMNAFGIPVASRQNALQGYRIPHRRLGRPIRRALVLGAGTGNDVAVLLDQGVGEVHAVEIDPGIIELGRDVHPNQPYSDPRVTVHNMDGRSFLNETEDRFDLIIFGTLDSMTRLSALSNVRLDNFIYTAESLAAARDRLTDDGGLALYFMVSKEHIHEHLLALLATTFGELPVFESGDFSMFNSVYMAGPGFRAGQAVDPGFEARYMTQMLPAIDVPTDDWPYLYLPKRGVTPFYLSIMGILVLIALAFVFGSSKELREAVRTGHGVDLEMMLFGTGFLLIETKFVTAMNLAWGATWITSAVVFGSILATILIATLVADRRPISWRIAAPLLVLTLVAVYLMPIQSLVHSSGATRLLLSGLYVGAPVGFAALCFADRFRTRPSADLAFGWNLLGAVIGGLLEFFSMSLGFSALTLVALVTYLGAFLLAGRAGSAPAPPEISAAA